jgi:hypothetical protein
MIKEQLIMNITHVLSDGVQIIQSNRKGNRSGYQGAAFSPAWTLDVSKPFVAACGNPTDPSIMTQLRAQHRTAWHGGCYADAREAAYVVARFKQDPVTTENEIYDQGGTWQQFPPDLYDLPVILTTSQAVKMIQDVKFNHPVQKTKPLTVHASLDFEKILRAVGVALKGLPRDNKLIKDTLQAQMPWFRNIDDAVGLALELVTRS